MTKVEQMVGMLATYAMCSINANDIDYLQLKNSKKL
ncbi:hypothetical protein DES39_0791 [Orbus hercynius]|uniref:Uncharacterized protein n=1 Tax=Orbus hercynius TaxID=593135 RepID=A0A495RJ39_9GAMM|nr:hypothetical protein DES39_0791 [Orbus hercynius]